MPDTHYPASVGRLRGYLATPTTPGPWPGVVVIHEAFGLTDDIRRQADRFAAEGYLAFAPDLYSYGFAPACLMTTMRGLLRGDGGRAIRDIDAAREFVATHDACTGKVGVIGFCMGGGFAILAAGRGFDASAPNYGPPPRNLAAALQGSCPMVASYGGRDRALAKVPTVLERDLTAQGIEHDVRSYDGAAHGFMVKHTGRWAWAERVPGLGYSAPDAADAWRRVFDFFARHL